MAASEEKKALPPTERPLGGVFLDEIAQIKKQARVGNKKRSKVLLAMTCVMLVILILVGGTFLGLYMKQGSAFKRTLQFRAGDRLYLETVETDMDHNTDTFFTEGDNGMAAVMFDHNKGLKAFNFSGRNICYIVPEDEKEDLQVKETARNLEYIEESSIKEVKNGGRRKMSIDESRTDAPELSEAMGSFCGDLQPRWGTFSSLPNNEDTRGDIVLIAPGMTAGHSISGEKSIRVKRGGNITLEIHVGSLHVCIEICWR